MSSPVEPLFLPLIVFGVVALLSVLIRLLRWLFHVRRGLAPTPATSEETEARQPALGKLLSSPLLWLGLLLLDSLGLLYVFVQGDSDRVLSGRVVMVMRLAGSGLIILALWIRLQPRWDRALGGSAIK